MADETPGSYENQVRPLLRVRVCLCVRVLRQGIGRKTVWTCDLCEPDIEGGRSW